MTFDEYCEFVFLFNGILKNTPINRQVYKTHYELVILKIKDITIFKECFKRHVLVSDWFPTHIDLFKHLEEVERDIRQEAEKNNPIIQEYKKLKALELEANDKFMINNDKEQINPLRDELLSIQIRVERMENQNQFLKELKY